MKNRTKKIIAAAALALGTLGLAGCSGAEVASHNISQDSDNFKVERRIVFINGITDKYLFSIEGRCSIQPDLSEEQLEVTCKTGEDQYKKHFLGLSDNVSYFVEQTAGADVSVNHYKVTFKPQSIVPDVDFRGSTSDIPKTD